MKKDIKLFVLVLYKYCYIVPHICIYIYTDSVLCSVIYILYSSLYVYVCMCVCVMCSVLKHMRRYRQFSHRLISNSFRNFSEEAELVSRAEQLATFKAARGRGGRGRGGRGPAAA